MPADAYWAVACAFMALAVLAMWLDRRRLMLRLRSAVSERGHYQDAASRWRDAYHSRTDQLAAARADLKEAQKNDRRGPDGRFVKAS